MCTIFGKAIGAGQLKILSSILLVTVICLYISTHDGTSKFTFIPVANYLYFQREKIQSWKFRPRVTCKCGLQQNFSKTTFEPKIHNMSSPLLRNSTCSPEATEAGESQKVVSFSFYNGKRPRNYTRDIEDNLSAMRRFYPGWLLRVYSDKPLDAQLCSLICGNQNDLFFCPIEFADGFDIGKVSKEFQMQWRFLVLGDPTVERFLVRDLDSRISEREMHAVREWENSGKTFHAMRDHPWHRTPIMGGCWGGNNKLLGEVSRVMQRNLTMNREIRCCAIDQGALETYVYSFNNTNSILIHDSYLCNLFQDSVPFPTQRVNLAEYVGQSVEFPDQEAPASIIVSECPEECRPSFGKRWHYC